MNTSRIDTYLADAKQYMNSGNDAAAAVCYEGVLDIDPAHKASVSELAKIYRKNKEYQKALKVFINALVHMPSDIWLLKKLSEVYEDMEDYDNAVETLQKSFNAGAQNDSEVSKSIIRLFIKNKDNSSAASHLSKLLALNDKTADAFLKNKINCNIELLSAKTILNSKPYKMGVCLTGKCNLACLMCGGKNDPELSSWDLPDKTFKEIIGLLPFLKDVQWHGGEVFLYKNFEELFEQASLYPQLQQGISTNGLFINRRWADKLMKSGTKLDLSIDGITRETYEYVRRGAFFDGLIEVLNHIRDARKKYSNLFKGKRILQMTFIIMKSNYKELEKVIEFAEQYNIDAVLFTSLTYFNPRETFEKENIANDPEIIGYIKGVMPELIKKANIKHIEVYSALPYLNETTFWGRKETIDKKEIKLPFCSHPWNTIFIDFGGVFKCQCSKCCNIEVGNIMQNTIESLWNNEAMQKYRENIIKNMYFGACTPSCDPTKMLEDPTYFDLL